MSNMTASLKKDFEKAKNDYEELKSMTTFTAVKDSGVREEFETGSRRDSREGKGRFDLLPAEAIKRVAVHYENGAVKYGDHNWKKGQPLSRYLDSAMRHLFDYLSGKRDEDHLSACVFNVMGIMWNEEKMPSMNDLD